MKTALASALAAAGSAIVLSACGGSAGADPASPSKHTQGPDRPGVSLPQQYADCMRAHGIPDFPNPVDGHITLTPSSGVNPNSPRFQAASEACAKYGPSAGGCLAAPAGTTTTGGSGTRPPPRRPPGVATAHGLSSAPPRGSSPARCSSPTLTGDCSTPGTT